MSNKKEAIEKIYPLVQEIRKICKENKLNYFFAIQTGGKDCIHSVDINKDSSEYFQEMLRLKEDWVEKLGEIQ